MYPVTNATWERRHGADRPAEYYANHLNSNDGSSAKAIEDLGESTRSGVMASEIAAEGREQSSRGSSAPAWLQGAGRVELLTREQEIALAQRMENAKMQHNKREEQRIKEKLVESNLRLVAAVARRYVGHGLPIEDLMQEGTIGLMSAVERFDWRKGYRFSTYAIWWIRCAINRAITDQAGLIRLPAHITDMLSRINRTRGALAQSLGRMPTHAELAEAVKLSETQLSELLRDTVEPLSLDMPLDDQGSSRLADTIPDTDKQDPAAEVTRYALRDTLQSALEDLTPREKQVLRLRYGLDGNEPHSLEETSRAVRLTRVMVYKIETLALKKLRRRDQLQYLFQETLPDRTGRTMSALLTGSAVLS